MRLTYIKNGESLKLDEAACIGCGACVEVCPHAVFVVRARKASIVEKSYCMECGACAKNCPVGCIMVKSGVGCAAAILNGLIRGAEATCGGDNGESSCGCKGS